MSEDDVKLDWGGAKGVGVQPVNIFVVQAGKDSHVLNLGYVAPPLGDESPETIPVHVVARVLLTPAIASALITALTDNVRRRKEKRQREQGAGDDD
jgi:hypothetical protein